MKKICKTCLTEKDLFEFAKKSTARGGIASECKECKKKYDIAYRQNNKLKLIEKRQNNKEQIKEWNEDWKKRNPDYFKEYHEKNHEKIIEKSRQYHLDNKDKCKEYRIKRAKEISESRKKHRAENKELYFNRGKEYRERNKERISAVKYKRKKERLKVDHAYKLKENLSCRVRAAIKAQSGKKAHKTIKLIGCEVDQLIKHLESQFKDGMSWDNYGLWEIDHIKPCASFNLSIPEEQKECFNYLNMQPLWREENMLKGAKII